MEITVKSVKVLKTGSNERGEWKLVKIVTDEGAEYTTLAKEADIIAEGVTINISNMDEKEYNGVVQKSFKKFEFVHGAAKPAEKGPVDTEALRTDKPPQIDDRTLDIHHQVAVKEIGELWRCGHITETDAVNKKLIAWYMNWIYRTVGIDVHYK